MKVRCSECAGKGELYLRIAGDVHIAKCAACDGWGSVEARLTLVTKAFKNFPTIKYHETVDLDALGDE